MTFEIKDRDAMGRIGKFTTTHGTITTPTLLPVINPNKMIISPKEMKHYFGTEMVITNAYIIYKDPHLRTQAITKGVHHLIDFDGPIMTDSGTFQSYVYGDVNLNPLEIVRFQESIKTDVGTILDLFGTPDQTYTQAQQTVHDTIQRAKQSIPLKKDMMLACTIQGSIYPKLRQQCAQELGKLNADFFPIGGVVPLMENQRYTDLIRCILASKKGLPPGKPVHLFGAGHPLIFPLAVALGCDFFDSSAYAKYATDHRMIFPWGTEKLDDLTELPCTCPICSTHTIETLKKLDTNQQVKQLAMHNLYISFAEIRNIRTAINQGTLWKLVEQRATAHPSLLIALQELQKKENKQFLEHYEPLSKKRAIFYTGPHTIHQPLIYRTHQRLRKRYKLTYDTILILPETKKPYSQYYQQKIQRILTQQPLHIFINSSLGLVPVELDEMYPYAQSIFPETIDEQTQQENQQLLNFFNNKKLHIINKLAKQPKRNKTQKKVDFDLIKITSIATMQFGRGAAATLFKGKITLIKSKTTHKIRNIHADGQHILSLRAEDGFFTLKPAGAQRLHTNMKKPRLRVTIHDDAVPFVKEGKNVFAKFVLDCDQSLIPYDECLIVDSHDTLIATGRTLLNKTEMLSFTTGVAVKTREPIINK